MMVWFYKLDNYFLLANVKERQKVATVTMGLKEDARNFAYYSRSQQRCSLVVTRFSIRIHLQVRELGDSWSTTSTKPGCCSIPWPGTDCRVLRRIPED